MKSKARRAALAGFALVLNAIGVSGCTVAGQPVDPDITVRAVLSVASDVAVFLLHNAVAGV